MNNSFPATHVITGFFEGNHPEFRDRVRAFKSVLISPITSQGTTLHIPLPAQEGMSKGGRWCFRVDEVVTMPGQAIKGQPYVEARVDLHSHMGELTRDDIARLTSAGYVITFTNGGKVDESQPQSPAPTDGPTTGSVPAPL